MKTIEIEDDVYRHLKNASNLGEGTSALLRRLLRMPVPTGYEAKPLQSVSNGSRSTAAEESRRIDEALEDRRFRVGRTAVDRFLFLLSWLHAKHPESFNEVLTLGGRSRAYFARTRQALEAAGTSVNPRQIPGTDFWVVTNNDTRTKEEILIDALGLLGYGPMDMAAVRGQLSVAPRLDDIV